MRRDRRVRATIAGRPTRAQVLELLLGPNGPSLFRNEEHRAEAWAQIADDLSPEFRQKISAEKKSYTSIAERYARQVVAGEIPACKWTRLACQRHLDDLERAAVGWEYEFNTAKADRACRFIELLPHTKGKWAARGQATELEPWQVFIVCLIFGWVKVLSQTRRFTTAILVVSRKNGKSHLAAGIGLYAFAADDEYGAEVYSGATSEKQAMEVFRPAYKMIETSPELAMVLGVGAPATKKLSIAVDGSRFEPVVKRPGDGASPHVAIADEYHEHPDDGLVDTFKTGMGAREQPLMFVITTAGTNLAGPCKLLQGDLEKILEGAMPGDDTFGIVYSIDEDDDWTTEIALEKANPNIGVSVSREFLKAEQKAAILKPRKQGIFQTKHLCVWVGATSAYFDLRKWKQLGDPELKPEDFIGLPCVIALDLSSRRDFTARCIGFKKLGPSGQEHYYLFPRLYLPEARALDPDKQHLQGWLRDGAFIVTPGDTIDFSVVTRETIADARTYQAREIAHDPWNADQLVQLVNEETGAEPVMIKQNVQELSAPTKELDALIAEERVHHDGNPAMNWMVGNVTAIEDRNENVFPQKEKGREENKIDGAMAAIMCIARLMRMSADDGVSVYESRGILVL